MKKTVSYIFPIYNESGNIALLHQTVVRAVGQLPQYEYEFVFVNDGSVDDSLTQLRALQASDPRMSVVNLARNFGHQIAVTAGLDHTTGDAVIIMDSDLQDPPEVSLQLIKKWEEGYDVVYAQRRTRKDGPFKRLTAYLFYHVLARLADIHIPPNTGDFRLIDRRVVAALQQFHEHNRFLRGLVSYVGFKQTAVLFDRHKRHAGVTGYPFKKMVKFAADGILGFSSAPLKLISRLGYCISLLSFLAVAYALLVKWLDPATVVPGWTFTIIAVAFIGGIQLIMLGVLGSYVGRIYTEAQNRPLYIIESFTPAREKKS